MKTRLLTLLLSALMILGCLTSCGGTAVETTADTTIVTEQTTTVETTKPVEMLDLIAKSPENKFFFVPVAVENYVGKLQEAVQKAGASSASVVYADHADEILSNGDHRFTVSCRYLSHQTFGVGASKKEAKQAAAREMLERI